MYKETRRRGGEGGGLGRQLDLCSALGDQGLDKDKAQAPRWTSGGFHLAQILAGKTASLYRGTYSKQEEIVTLVPRPNVPH